MTLLVMTYGGVLHVVTGAPCCAPNKWASEVRVVTMDTDFASSDGKEDYYWISYDLGRQQIAVITFDPRPGHGDFYRRGLLDYGKGLHYVTPDEVKCTVTPLSGSMPRLCVPPAGGNITLDIRMFFGVFPEPEHSQSRRGGPEHSDAGVGRHGQWEGEHSARTRLSQTPRSNAHDSFGMYAETIYYETDNVTGYVTVTAPTCCFVNQMTYATLDGGRLMWQHTQWNNITLTVDPDSFNMPASCGHAALPGQVNNDGTPTSTHGPKPDPARIAPTTLSGTNHPDAHTQHALRP